MLPRTASTWLALAVTSACGTPNRARQAPAPEAAAETRAEAAAEAPSEPPSLDEPPAEPKAEASSQGVDLDEWAFRHKLDVKLVADGCEAAELGARPDDLIWCAHHQDKSQIVLYTRALYAARGKQVVKLVELPVGVATLPNPEAPEPDADRFRVRLALERPAGGKLEVREASGYDCAKARAANEEDKAVNPALYKELAGAIRDVCAQRGTWTFAGGALRLTRRAPTGAPPR